MPHFDVAILGAGPAGATTALALRKCAPHLTIVIIEATDFQIRRPGELLDASAISIMQKLDVYHCFTEQRHQQITYTNPSTTLPSSSNIFGAMPAGKAWIVERSRFDGMLAGIAAASGTSFMRSAVTDVGNQADGSWQLQTQSPTQTCQLSASFVVDATGRGAKFATKIGCKQIAHDTLLGVVRVIDLDNDNHQVTGPLIEAFEHGWWYSTPIAGNRMVIAAMTDADINKHLQLSHISCWNEQLKQSPLTYQRVQNLTLRGEIYVRAAHTRNLQNCAGENWLAVGDAATSMDPLTSRGMEHAMRFGLHAAEAIAEHFNDRTCGMDKYHHLVSNEFEHCLELRAEQYARELRWQNSPFWARRLPGVAVTKSMMHRQKKTLSLSIR